MEVTEKFPWGVPGGVFNSGPSAYPDDVSLVASEGEGCYVRTDSGEEYLDYLLGSGPMLIGHAHPHVVEAVTDRIAKGSTFYLPSEPGLSLAERIVEAVPCANGVKFVSSGTEATFYAHRLARAYTGNETILKFEGGFHGWHDYALISSNRATATQLRDIQRPNGTVDSAGIPRGVIDSMVVAPFNDLDATETLIRSHVDELAGVIVEPLMRSLPPVDGFLEGLRDVCTSHEIPLIFDEIVTGFRHAWGGAQEYYGVEPDIATYGKAIGGGTPISAICATEEIIRLADTTIPPAEGGAFISGTFNGNPLSAVAGHATLDVLEQKGTYPHLNAYADDFRALIADVLADSGLDGQPLGDGPIVDYIITDESTVTAWKTVLASDTETKRAIDRRLLDAGILQHHGGKRYISTEHGPEELERTAEAFKTAVEQVSP